MVDPEQDAELDSAENPPASPPTTASPKLTPSAALARLPMTLVLLLLVYFLMWPTDLKPEGWQPPMPNGLTGAYAANDMLAQSQIIELPTSRGAADLAQTSNGTLFAGVANGAIVNLTTGEQLAKTKGRPLGMEAYGQGGLVVADAELGLLEISTSGEIAVLVDAEQRDGQLFAFGVDVADDDTIYFSDASTVFGFDAYKRAILDNRPNGRLLAYSPESGNLNILLDDVYFAAGVAVAADQSAVFVAETARFRIRRYPLVAEPVGDDIWIENLPGYPLGLAMGADGTLWVAIGQLRNERLDQIGEYGEGRRIIGRIPPMLMLDYSTHPMLLGFDQDGNLIHNLQDSTGVLGMSTAGVLATEEGLYWGALGGKAVGQAMLP